MKKLTGVFFALLILICFSSGNVFAKEIDSGKTYNDLTWSLSDDYTLTISGKGEFEGFPTYDSPITSYDTAYYKSVKKIVFGEGVTGFGDSYKVSFSDWTSLESVYLPSTIKNLGNGSLKLPFWGCKYLKEVIFSEYCTNLEEIPDSAFYLCTSLKKINIPSSVTSIGSGAFMTCRSLSELDIPEGVAKIGASAFRDCSSLGYVVFPKSIEIIDSCAFLGCSSLTKVRFLGSLPSFCVSNSLAECFPEKLTVEYPIGNSSYAGKINSDIYYGTKTTWVSYIPEGHTHTPGNALTENISVSGTNICFDEAVYCTVCNCEVSRTFRSVSASSCVKTSQLLSVNGEIKEAEIYNIGGNNYFKLRDIALLLNGTEAQFSVRYDEAQKKIVSFRGNNYYPVGGELSAGADNSKSCVISSQPLLVDGKTASMVVFNIGGSNFFKLRDLGDTFGFSVDYDAETRTMMVSSNYSYTTMYALDDRTMNVIGSQISAYQAVGWYLFSDYLTAKADNLWAWGDKDGALSFLEKSITNLEYIKKNNSQPYNCNFISYDTDGDLSLCHIKYDALKAEWKKTAGNLAVVSYKVGSYYGYPEVCIVFRNLSDKEIIDIDVSWTCLDAYGNATADYGSAVYKGFLESGCTIKAGERSAIYWTIYRADKMKNMTAPVISKIAFADGTIAYK